MRIDSESLWKTLDSISEDFFFGREISAKDKLTAAKWIASRQGLKGSCYNMFAPTASDFELSRTFTGEKIASKAATAHILSEEALRCLKKLGINDDEVKTAYRIADEDMIGRLGKNKNDRDFGRICCGTCSVAFWRNLIVGGFNHQEARLRAGMAELKKTRLETGKWRLFPFFWTLSALIEIDMKEAVEEMRYAAPAIERSLKKSSDDPVYDKRRKAICETVLGKV
jgi:hypothetical protein